MTLANRVGPDGQITANPARCRFTGNRGCLVDADGQMGRARWRGKAWITCTLAVRPGWGKHPLNAPGRWTPLFFHDEAVAAAAGHRPCAACRRADYLRFRGFWQQAFGTFCTAAAMDAALHAARIDPATRQPQRYQADAHSLPSGTFIDWQGAPHLIWDDAALPFHGSGYDAPCPVPSGVVTVLTPQPMVAVMQAGWRPEL